MDETEQSISFAGNKANLDLVIDDIVEVIRSLLRALAAKDPAEQVDRALVRLRSFVTHGNGLPAERVLLAAIAKLKNLEATIAEDGYIAETTLLAVKYFAEATTEEGRFSGANRRRALDQYRTAINSIGEIDQLRRGH